MLKIGSIIQILVSIYQVLILPMRLVILMMAMEYFKKLTVFLKLQ